jgi:hypothetical protein
VILLLVGSRLSTHRLPSQTTLKRSDGVPILARMEWDAIELSALFGDIRQRFAAPDAERMIWAFERALETARLDERLLDYLLVATVCLVAHAQSETPRTVLEQVFRRSVSDGEWRDRFAPLLG